MMIFFFNFNYMILKDTKEPLIVTASGSGAETLAFLKMWAVLPLAFIFMIVFAKLSNVYKKQTLFYGTVIFFISFFALFGFVLYPLKDSLHPIQFADKLQTILPIGLKGFIAIFRNWTFSLYYAMAELWGSVGLSLLFWGFANDITSVKESKRFYTLFALGASLAMLFSGPIVIYFSQIRKYLPASSDPWSFSLKCFTSIVVLGGLIIMGLYWWINKNVITDKRFYNPDIQKNLKKEKPKMTLRQAFKHLSRSKYFRLMAVLVIGYAVCNLFVEMVWKSQLKIQFPNPNDYSIFRGYYTTITSICSFIMLLFVGGNIFRKSGWRTAAIITPFAFLIGGIAFFSFVVFRSNLTGMIAFFGTTPVFLAVVFGVIQNVFSKSCKSSLFEPSKEMLYIPLDQEAKTKGKAALDVLVVKLGKAGGSFTLQGLIIFLGSLVAATPYIAVLLIAMVISWIGAVNRLDKQMKKDEKQKQQSEVKKELIPQETT
jgi:ATP:ADP antiporter, AAA family